MSDVDQFYARVRIIKRVGVAILVLTVLAWFVLRNWRDALNGLLLGELGGVYVVYSMIRQGHLRDRLQGKALFASGMSGMFTRMAVLAAIMVVAVKTPQVNPYLALVGYMLGFVLVFIGLVGFVRNQKRFSK